MMLSKAVVRQLSRVPRRWRPATLLATWFGCGLLPWIPGTWASLAALPAAWLLVLAFGPVALAMAAALLLVVGWWASGVYERAAGVHDPSAVVIDEVAAQWAALVVVPLEFAAYLLCFVIFRAADMLKLWPAGVIDRRVSGGLGIMLDDLVAAAYAAAGVTLVVNGIL